MAPVAMLCAKLLLPLIGDITASEWMLSRGVSAWKSKAQEVSLLESSAINLTPFWIQGSSPLIIIRNWSSERVYALSAQGLELGCESLRSRERGRFIPNYSIPLLRSTEIIICFLNFFRMCFPQRSVSRLSPPGCVRSPCDITVKYLDIWFSFFSTFYWVPRVSAGVRTLWTASSKPVSELLQLANGPCNVFPQRYHYSAFHMAGALINKLWNALKSGEKFAGMKRRAVSQVFRFLLFWLSIWEVF